MNARSLAPRIAAVLIAPAVACGGEDRDDPRVDVVDVRGEQERERAPASSLIEPLITPLDPGRLIYEPPPDLARVSMADSIAGRRQPPS